MYSKDAVVLYYPLTLSYMPSHKPSMWHGLMHAAHLAALMPVDACVGGFVDAFLTAGAINH